MAHVKMANTILERATLIEQAENPQGDLR
jgi:hypothetical protein